MNPDIDAIIAQVNAERSRAEKVRAHLIMNTTLSIEDGTLTPTLKVRRRDVIERMRADIDKLY